MSCGGCGRVVDETSCLTSFWLHVIYKLAYCKLIKSYRMISWVESCTSVWCGQLSVYRRCTPQRLQWSRHRGSEDMQTATSTGTDTRSRHMCRRDTLKEVWLYRCPSLARHSAESRWSSVRDDMQMWIYTEHKFCQRPWSFVQDLRLDQIRGWWWWWWWRRRCCTMI